MDGMGIFVGAGVVIVVAAILVVLFLKKANSKYGELWAPLATMVGGSSKGAKLMGTFNGVPVTARINAVSDDDATDYFYELTLATGAQGKDWALSYTGDKLLGMGAKRWHITAKDEVLKQRLAGAGAVATVEQWPSYPEVSYKAKSGTLKYSTKVQGCTRSQPLRSSSSNWT